MALKHFHFESLESTQDKVFELLSKNEEAPIYVTTDLQTKGRGRMQREWKMERGRSMALSLGLRLPPQKMVGLSLVVGLGVVKALGRDDISIKWPNDLMLGEQKVGGILIESHSQGAEAEVAIGIGLNLYDLQMSKYTGIKQNIYILKYDYEYYAIIVTTSACMTEYVELFSICEETCTLYVLINTVLED